MKVRGLAALAVAALAGIVPAWSSRSTNWRETPESLDRGEAEGVAVTSRGVLFAAPRYARLGDSRLPGEPDQVLAIAADASGALYLGTGPEGRILKITSSGRPTSFFEVDEPLVTALAVAGNGDLLAGTAPGGKIFRIGANGEGSLWCETGERYVWDLAVALDGTIYAATGERGAVLKIRSSGQSEPFFDSDETHIISLLALPDGSLLAGGGGRGLVYRIDEEGHGLVLYEDELPEATALAVERTGDVLVAMVAPPAPQRQRPEVLLRLPDGTRVGRSDENVGQLEESSGPLLRGQIQGLPGRLPVVGPELRGRVVRVNANGEAREIWRSSTETPFCLLRSGGDFLLGTGDPGRLYRLSTDGEVARLVTLPQSQVTGLGKSGSGVVVVTSNPAAAYRLDGSAADPGTFLSAPVDAGAAARWGAIRWHVEGADGGPRRVEVYTRTGNSREPDTTWSGWSPAMIDEQRSRVVNPDGRYLQWRARFTDPKPEGARLSSISVHFEPLNRPPEVKGFRLEAHERWVSGIADLVWSVRDPDGDAVEMTLSYRAGATGPWESILVPPTSDNSGGGSSWHEKRFSWDTSSVAEGEYEVRAEASDRAVNGPEEGRSVLAEPSVQVVIDRTAPTYEVRPLDRGGFEVILDDGLSEIRPLEVLSGDRVVFVLRPSDGVCDSRRESFSVDAEIAGNAKLDLRGVDAAGNQVKVPLTR